MPLYLIDVSQIYKHLLKIGKNIFIILLVILRFEIFDTNFVNNITIKKTERDHSLII